MSDAVQVALIVAIPPTILALATLIQAIGNARQMRGVRRDVNGRMTELLDAKEKAARAEGQLSVVMPPGSTSSTTTTGATQPAPTRPV